MSAIDPTEGDWTGDEEFYHGRANLEESSTSSSNSYSAERMQVRSAYNALNTYQDPDDFWQESPTSSTPENATQALQSAIPRETALQERAATHVPQDLVIPHDPELTTDALHNNDAINDDHVDMDWRDGVRILGENLFHIFKLVIVLKVILCLFDMAFRPERVEYLPNSDATCLNRATEEIFLATFREKVIDQ